MVQLSEPRIEHWQAEEASEASLRDGGGEGGCKTHQATEKAPSRKTHMYHRIMNP